MRGSTGPHANSTTCRARQVVRSRPAPRIAHRVATEALTNPFYAELVEPLRRELARRGYRTVLVTDDSDDVLTADDLTDGSYDGAVITTAARRSGLAGALAARGMPHVLANRVVDAADSRSCTFANAHGAELIANLLAELGHQRIGLLIGPERYSTAHEREEGLRAELRRHHITLPPDLVRRVEYTADAGRAAALSLLEGPLRPMAIVCGNDLVAIGAGRPSGGRGGMIVSVNRTDRLYAIVEELRAVSPRPRSARWLAERFEVSVRTIERDQSALQQSGAPIWGETGRAGGYAIDATATLGPMGFTSDEALAILVGLGTLRRGPFRHAAGTALRKFVAVTPDEDARRAMALAARVHLLEPDVGDPVPPAFAAAFRADRVVRLEYRDRGGAVTLRDVEPLGSIGKDGIWYLIAWCRLRVGVRAFRGDRVTSAELTDERPEPRALRREDLDIPFGTLRSVVDDAY